MGEEGVEPDVVAQRRAEVLAIVIIVEGENLPTARSVWA